LGFLNRKELKILNEELNKNYVSFDSFILNLNI